jgi:TBC1 domain family member 20
MKSESKLSARWKELPPHRDEEQVQLDVNRAFVYYPNGGSVTSRRVT